MTAHIFNPGILACLMIAYLGNSYAWDIGLCTEALGMESGAILDEAITASSSYVPNVGPRNGRLRIEKAGGGWCPKQQVEKGIKEFLQVDLGSIHVITGIQTQGRYDRGRGQEYAEEYTVEYTRPEWTEWKEYKRWNSKQILKGNSDTASVETHRLMPPIFASKIRILPYSEHRRTVCLRVELLGCIYEGGIVTYSIPEGSDMSQGLYDSSYDGESTDVGHLINGLGRLVDGEIGADNFRLDIGLRKGNGWIGWKNDSFPNGFVELIFEFDQIRNFSALYLYTNNFFSKNVQVFEKAKVMFSIGGLYYNGPTLSYSYMPDTVLENARNVSINLHGRVARFIKIRLYFADRWIMISEVDFDSVPLPYNVTEEETIQLEEDELVIGSTAGKSLDTFETVAAKKESEPYVEVVIGVLTAVMLLLLLIFIAVLLLNKRNKLMHGSPTTLLRNPFSMKINMKDFLMSFSFNTGAQSSHNNNVSTPISDHPEGPSDPLFEPASFHPSPLVESYYDWNYGVQQKVAADKPEVKVAPEVPPLPESLPLNGEFVESLLEDRGRSPKKTNHYSSSTIHYRTLQNNTAASVNGSPKSKTVNLENYFPNIGTDPPSRKRYNTAPKDKQKVPPPVVFWNLAPSMGHSYNCREVELMPIPKYTLRHVEKIGSCYAGTITLYETEGLSDIIPGVCRLVAVRTPCPEKVKTEAASGSLESLREVRFLAGLSDPNICRILGVCTAEQPPWTVIEYGEMGDLSQYLQFMVERNGGNFLVANEQPMSVGSLIYMTTQIASGMKYLESKHVVHKDLAARNCLVGRGHIVKIADVAMCKSQYKKDYTEIGGRPPTPIRWLPWESILLDRYTCASSVWSFAVTMWEIFNFACDRPFSSLSNERVLQNTEHMYYGGELQVTLYKPTACSIELYKMMCQCWRRDDAERPTFKQIYSILKHLNKEYLTLD